MVTFPMASKSVKTPRKKVHKVADVLAEEKRKKLLAKGDPETLAAAAIDRRIRSHSIQEISDEFGLTVAKAKKLILEAFKEAFGEVDKNFEKQLALARTEALIKSLWPLGADGEIDPAKAQHFDRVKGFMELRARYIGLYAPIKTENNDKTNPDPKGLNKKNADFIRGDILGVK